MKSLNKEKSKLEAQSSPTKKAPFAEAFKFWLKLGFISFGGPAGQIAIMHRELVERKKWIDEESFLHALNFCMLLPGPEAQQLATYNGWRLHGTKGGIIAGAFFVIPSIFVLLALSYVYAKYGNVREIAGVLDGLKPVVVAIVVEASLKIGKKAFKGWFHIALAALAFVAIFALHVPFPLIVLLAGIAGYAYFKFQNSNAGNADSKNEELRAAAAGIDSADEGEPKTQNSRFRILKTVAVFVALWLVPLVSTGLVYGWRSLPIKVYLFFTQAAFVTFGGAYSVLAYVNQAMVDSYGWITAGQAIDGFALAETTPGPLIMVLQFIGFMTGWNAGAGGTENQIGLAVVCALLTTFATFLPSFMFIFLGAPYVEKLRGNEKLSAALQGVTAAVVGVILNLALAFGAAVIFSGASVVNWFALAVSVLAFITLLRFKFDVMWIVLAGGVLGLLKVLFFG
jgi:chromate transporter